ncbi:hypothetical protein ACLOJK_040281 [Asimina triloba]
MRNPDRSCGADPGDSNERKRTKDGNGHLQFVGPLKRTIPTSNVYTVQTLYRLLTLRCNMWGPLVYPLLTGCGTGRIIVPQLATFAVVPPQAHLQNALARGNRLRRRTTLGECTFLRTLFPPSINLASSIGETGVFNGKSSLSFGRRRLIQERLAHLLDPATRQSPSFKIKTGRELRSQFTTYAGAPRRTAELNTPRFTNFEFVSVKRASEKCSSIWECLAAESPRIQRPRFHCTLSTLHRTASTKSGARTVQPEAETENFQTPEIKILRLAEAVVAPASLGVCFGELTPPVSCNVVAHSGSFSVAGVFSPVASCANSVFLPSGECHNPSSLVSAGDERYLSPSTAGGPSNRISAASGDSCITSTGGRVFPSTSECDATVAICGGLLSSATSFGI